jgi:acyl dehydratase
MREGVTAEEFMALVGSELGVSAWTTVDQARIDGFAEVTGDHQFIHVDPEAARASPLGTTVAHGFLSLSLVAAFSREVVPGIRGTRMSFNYGINRLRFLAPVRSGSRVRGRFKLKGVEAQDHGRYLANLEVQVEIEGGERPALALEWLILMMT